MVDSMCEKCQQTPGTAHAFHYGKKARIPVVDEPTVYQSNLVGNMHATWSEHYEMGGVDTAILCADCLRRARARRAARALVRNWLAVPLVTLLYALGALGIVVWVVVGDWTQVALWSVAVVGSAAIAYSVIYLMFETEDFAQQAAFELHEEHLRDEGWDAFWTDREFLGLTPH